MYIEKSKDLRLVEAINDHEKRTNTIGFIKMWDTKLMVVGS